MGTPQTMWVDESERWAPLWVDADSKKSQICVVQMAKNPGTLFLSYTLAKTSLEQAVQYTARSSL